MTFNNFKRSFHDLFEKQRNCDVAFCFNNPTSANETSNIMAHKLVLSVASDVFNTMFFGEAAKHEKLVENKPINIDDIKMKTFKLFLR